MKRDKEEPSTTAALREMSVELNFFKPENENLDPQGKPANLVWAVMICKLFRSIHEFLSSS